MVSRLLSAHFRLGQEGTHDGCRQELQVGGPDAGPPDCCCLLVSHKLLPTVSSPQARAPAIESTNKAYSEATAVRAYRSPWLLQNC